MGSGLGVVSEWDLRGEEIGRMVQSHFHLGLGFIMGLRDLHPRDVLLLRGDSLWSRVRFLGLLVL